MSAEVARFGGPADRLERRGIERRFLEMAYDGGKDSPGVSQTIINQIPPHDLFITACLGDCAVLRRKRPATRNVAIEIDPDVAAAFKCDRVPRLEIFCCDSIEWLRHEFGLYRLPTSLVSATQPGEDLAAESSDFGRPEYLVAEKAGPAGQAGEKCDGCRQLPLMAIADKNSGSAGSHNPASKAFVLWDPPYPRWTRRNGAKLYRYEMTHRDHAKLLETANLLPCMVMICSYWSEMYAEALRGWRLLRYSNQTRKGRVEECLWMNYPEATELHDARFIGRNKRQRERVRRRVRNWTAALRRMPPLERQAILDAIDAHHHQSPKCAAAAADAEIGVPDRDAKSCVCRSTDAGSCDLSRARFHVKTG